MNGLRRPALALALALASLGAGAARAQDSACAKIEEPLAYNACLANHGPKAGAVRAEPEPAGGASSSALARKGHARGVLIARKTRRGKVEMEFDIGK